MIIFKKIAGYLIIMESVKFNLYTIKLIFATYLK